MWEIKSLLWERALTAVLSNSSQTSGQIWKQRTKYRKSYNIRSSKIAFELPKEQKQLTRKFSLSLYLPFEKLTGMGSLNRRHVLLTFIAFCALGSPSSMSSKRIPPSPRWSCLSKSLSRAFLSFKLYLGLKAYFPSTTSIFGLLTRACNKDVNFKPWKRAHASTFLLVCFWAARAHQPHVTAASLEVWVWNGFYILGS